MSLDLNKLENKLDEALSNETTMIVTIAGIIISVICFLLYKWDIKKINEQ